MYSDTPLDRAIGRMAESVTWAADGIAKLAIAEAAESAPANAISCVISLCGVAFAPNTMPVLGLWLLECGTGNAVWCHSHRGFESHPLRL